MEDIVKATNTFATKVKDTGWYIGTRNFKDTFFKAMYACVPKEELENYNVIFKDLNSGCVKHEDLNLLEMRLEQVESLMMKYKKIDVSTDIQDDYDAQWKDRHEITNLGNSFITRMGDNVFDELISSIDYAQEINADLEMVNIQDGYLKHVTEPDPDEEKVQEIVKIIEKGDQYPNHLVMHQKHDRMVLPKFSDSYTSIDFIDRHDKLLKRRYFDHSGMVHMEVTFEE